MEIGFEEPDEVRREINRGVKVKVVITFNADENSDENHVSKKSDLYEDGIYAIDENGLFRKIDYTKPNDFVTKWVGIKEGGRSLRIAMKDAGRYSLLRDREDCTEGIRYIENVHEAARDMKGYENTLSIISRGTDIPLKKMEYIPAAGQAIFMFEHLDEINKALEYTGGETISESWYWTSSENAAAYAWGLNFGSGYLCNNGKVSYQNRVRAVSDFIG